MDDKEAKREILQKAVEDNIDALSTDPNVISTNVAEDCIQITVEKSSIFKIPKGLEKFLTWIKIEEEDKPTFFGGIYSVSNQRSLKKPLCSIGGVFGLEENKLQQLVILTAFHNKKEDMDVLLKIDEGIFLEGKAYGIDDRRSPYGQASLARLDIPKDEYFKKLEKYAVRKFCEQKDLKAKEKLIVINHSEELEVTILSTQLAQWTSNNEQYYDLISVANVPVSDEESKITNGWSGSMVLRQSDGSMVGILLGGGLKRAMIVPWKRIKELWPLHKFLPVKKAAFAKDGD